jgi:hypothetical protein
VFERKNAQARGLRIFESVGRLLLGGRRLGGGGSLDA